MAITAADRFRSKSKKALEDRDFSLLEKIYMQYGGYLELIGDDAPCGRQFSAVIPKQYSPSEG